MIFGTSLKFLSYSGELINDFCLHNSSSLVEACIYLLGRDNRPREVAYRVNKLLRGISNVNDLILSSKAVEVLDYAEELFVHLPMFNSLTSLEVDLWLMDFNCRAFLSIFQDFPCLESLLFSEGIGISTSFGKGDWILDPVPPCFLSHLTSIEVHKFYGNEQQLCVIKILLKNARVLDRMVLSCYGDFPGGLENQKKVHEQLIILPRASMSSIVLS
ncbi:hypothetical protein L1049_009946 [Liquidambar formosana]|uniref:FBD domain-containing protein n=1 Tax=Liquidambar formosana TaxID=63359 RepID=A0AAP0N7K6_LIQFO